MNLETMLGRLSRIVNDFALRMERTGEVRQWRLEPVLRDTLAHGLHDVFRANFTEIDRFHDLGSSDDTTKDIIHYTNLGMLISALKDLGEDRESFLRMYDSFHLNDPEEGQFLIRHIRPEDQLRWFKEQKASHAYVASFIVPDDCNDQELGDEDNLKYWLAYGRRGRGCSIRFPVNSRRFRRVCYGQHNAARTADILALRSIWNCLDPLTASQDQELSSAAIEVFSEAMWSNLAQIAYLYKDDSYSYEQECRLVRSVVDVPEGSVYFESVGEADSSDRTRHYYQDDDLRMDRILVTDSIITLGPLVSRPRNMVYYINTLLQKAGLIGPSIEISKIPYQEPWQ